MKKNRNLKSISLVLVIFLLPFTDFIKNNINEIDIILGKSFFSLIFTVFFIIFILAHVINFFFRTKDFSKIFLIITIMYWLMFKHNFLNIGIKAFFNNFLLLEFEYISEISLLILIILSIYSSVLIYKNSVFFKKFIFVFFYLSFFVSLFQIFSFNQKLNIDESSEINTVSFPDKLNIKKENIYFFILDGMQPIREFEKHYKYSQKDFLNNIANNNYIYIHNTSNIYDNTTHTLSAFFYLDKVFDEKNKLNKKTKTLYPSLMRKNIKTDLLDNLDKLGYDFKWLGNFFAYCPKFNLKYCLNKKKDKNTIIDTYLLINFLGQTPLIQAIIKFGYIFNFDFDKHFFYDLNNGIGRLTNYLKKSHKIDKPTFYFVHHMSPHWPYITNTDCSYKKYPGDKNFEGYESAYICTLKKIQETIKFLNKFDPNSTVVFQSDHNWVMSKNKQEKKMIFNLIKINNNCTIDSDINLNNVNTLRLIFSCMTGNEAQYINN